MEKRFSIRKIAIIFVTLAFLLFQLYLALIKPLHPLLQNPIHLLFALAIAFLHYPIVKNTVNGVEIKGIKKYLFIVDISILASIAFLGWYFLSQHSRLTNRIIYLDSITILDYVSTVLIIAILLEAIRRVMGINLLIFIGIFIFYGLYGKIMPSFLMHRGISGKQFTDLMIMGTDGIFGIPLNASVNFLYYFIIFGVLFASLGGGKVFMDLGLKISSKSSGGPAKAAVLSSAFLGMINGSAVANVTTSGVMTIPLMKKAGYRPEQAAAIEAVASTGGQIMPPIMGVGAFIMAEMIGISYANIALAAIIPAVVYFVSIFLLVDLMARKKNISDSAYIDFNVEPILRRLYLLIPIILVIYNIFKGHSLMYSALVGIVASLVINLLRYKKGVKPKELFECLIQGTKQAAGIALPTAACGIIIGIVIMSGLATKLANIIFQLGDGSLILALIITALGCIVLGMALPTVAAYLSAYVLFMPVLLKLGIPVLPANLFIFYYGIVAQITPPVSLASFAAAGIAEASPWKTGWTAFSYGLVAFLVPFAFVFKPELLLMGSVQQIIVASLLLFAGTLFLAVSLVGYLLIPIKGIIPRVVILFCSILTILPEKSSSYIGIIIFMFITVCFYIKSKKDVGTASARNV